MTYAIMTPMYGIPLRSNKNEIKLSDVMHELLDSESNGFLRLYSGSGDEPRAFAVIIGDSVDECCHHIELSDFIFVANEKQIEKFNMLYSSLEDDIKNEMKQFGEPRVFYLMSTS